MVRISTILVHARMRVRFVCVWVGGIGGLGGGAEIIPLS